VHVARVGACVDIAKLNFSRVDVKLEPAGLLYGLMNLPGKK
jgi:hypothetical protein